VSPHQLDKALEILKGMRMTPERFREEARRRLENLMRAGRKEALGLNNEYDKMAARASQLRAEAERAEQELRDFEREKLGMHPAEKK
jgi:predicted phage gp36 major capsid-like protein